MDDTETKLQHEVRELRAEVRRLKLFIEGVILVAIIVLGMIVPGLIGLILLVGGLIVFALLVSPVRHLIFPSIFRNRNLR